MKYWYIFLSFYICASLHCYIPAPTKPDLLSPSFTRSDYLSHYVEVGQQVLNHLLTLPWVDSSKVIVAGHSQGAKSSNETIFEDIF